MITSADIRERYVRFFLERDHRKVASAPLVPPDDPTLLFTTAGMVQFKAYYSGSVPLPFHRAVSVQKCLRAGGKGSDLENVGRTLRHHTFFEMLGNFSFGDYFKREAITWAWEFCTGAQWLNLPGERIWATIYGKPDGEGGWIVDDEAEKIWIDETGVSNPIIRLDEKENFWGPAGSTGACGPCSEIKFFMGSEERLREYQALARSGPEGMAKVAHDIVEEGDLFLEIWNLVFPQFDQQPDGSRPMLKNRGIDTGAGLERVTTACQSMASGGMILSPYETDLMSATVGVVAGLSRLPYPKLKGSELDEARLRDMGRDPAAVRLAMNACADHARALTFALTEGVIPSNEGRGYVIRRILRRAARFGRKLGLGEPFLWRLVDPIIESLGAVYPEITQYPEQIKKTIRSEEERFSRTLDLGEQTLDEIIRDRKPGHVITGEEAYRLYDTYGFPLDLTEEVAVERGLTVDLEGFDRLLKEGKKKARASWKGGAGEDPGALLRDLKDAGRATEFKGYVEWRTPAQVTAIIRGGERVDSLQEGQPGIIVLDQSPFYGEGGGQIGDTGSLRDEAGVELFRVEDTQKSDEGFVFHYGQAAAPVSVGMRLTAEIDSGRRWDTMKHHSATHLLQGALKRLIGPHVTQAGSYVGPDYLRFDFTNPEAIGPEQIQKIEAIVNEQVQRNLPVTCDVMDLDEARATGAIAPFGEKYGARVRVVRMGDFSTEFCGGTHLKATGEIGPFIVTGESSVAAGVRRIEARVGRAAADVIARDREIVNRLSRQLTVPVETLPERIAALQAEIKALKRQAEQAKVKSAAGKADEFRTETVGDVAVVSGWLDGADLKALRSTMDAIKAKRQGVKTVVILGSGESDRATLVVGATDDLAGSPMDANNVIKQLAPLFDAKGGGKPSFAQAGGKDPARLKEIIDSGQAMEKVAGLAPA